MKTFLRKVWHQFAWSAFHAPMTALMMLWVSFGLLVLAVLLGSMLVHHPLVAVGLACVGLLIGGALWLGRRYYRKHKPTRPW